MRSPRGSLSRPAIRACLVALLAAAVGGPIEVPAHAAVPVLANPAARDGVAAGSGMADSRGMAAAGAAVPTGPQVPARAQPPSRQSIQVALAALRQDPNLGTQRTVRHLHWIDSKSPPPPATPPWIVGLFQFFSQAAGFLIWVAGAIGLAIALAWLFRLIRARAPRAAMPRTAPASHVGDLDIRPDSLPGDVGGAALALLEAGRTREALSLLYRAALSRAVHRFGVPIEDSFTEGEALRAVARRLDRIGAQYFTDLIDQWQRVVYGGRTVAPDPVRALCTGFSPALDAGGP